MGPPSKERLGTNDYRRIREYLPARNPFEKMLDALLADIAIMVQLPPGSHAKACERYEAIYNYLFRPESPLTGFVVQFYPQGSMAIDATTFTRGTDSEYDLDAVLEGDFPAGGQTWIASVHVVEIRVRQRCRGWVVIGSAV